MPKVKIDDTKGLVQSAGTGVTVESQVVCENSGGLRDAKLMRSVSVAGADPTAISATALSVNTYYKSIAAATAMTIPASTSSNIGDWITVYYSVAIGNGNAHTYTTTTDTTFALGSTAVRVGGGVASVGDLAVAADNVLTITGHTNGDGGLGTTVKFVQMTGTANGWAVEAVTLNQGTGAQAGTIAFS